MVQIGITTLLCSVGLKGKETENNLITETFFHKSISFSFRLETLKSFECAFGA